MKSLVTLICFLKVTLCLAGEPIAIPSGWVEMRTPDPILLSWAKVSADKKLEESPTVMIQKHPISEKWKSALEKISLSEDGCRKVPSTSASGWNQLYCEKKSDVYVYLWRGEDTQTLPALEQAKLWLKQHE